MCGPAGPPPADARRPPRDRRLPGPRPAGLGRHGGRLPRPHPGRSAHRPQDGARGLRRRPGVPQTVLPGGRERTPDPRPVHRAGGGRRPRRRRPLAGHRLRPRSFAPAGGRAPRPAPAPEVLRLVAGIAEALQAIHGAGVIHRDLKPANVLIAEDGPRVIDFGIARAADATGLTGTGLRIGTAAFMAPEQALGHAVTPATDVFALGATAAYVAGGVLPFGAGPESAALYRVVHEPADLSRVPAELRELIGHCLAKSPERRPTPAELIAAVRAHLALGPGQDLGGLLPSGGHRPPVIGGGFSPHDRPTRTAAPAVHMPTERVATGGWAGDDSRGGGAPGGGVPGGSIAEPDAEPVRQGGSGGRKAGSAVARRGRRRGRTALVAGGAAVVAGLVGAAGVAYWLTGAPDGGGSGRAAEYTPGYADVELTVPDDGYEFDLGSGKVAPAETAVWYLARDKRGFVLPEDANAFVASGYALGPADCERGVDAEPVTSLPFNELVDERPFCVRSADGERLVVARLVEGGSGAGPVTVVLSQYRRNG
ncbi:protein kinase domain-containing protein [Streptomyces narbonensis]